MAGLKIAHINFDAGSPGGATIAMLRMHRAMVAQKMESRVFCLTQADDADSFLWKVPAVLRALRLLYKVVSKILFRRIDSTGLVPSRLYKAVNACKPDFVVLHWLQMDTMSMSEIRKLKAPVIWYHHDLWPICGITACEWFAVPKRLLWLDSLVKRNKRRVARQMGVTLIPACASLWVADEIRRSGMYSANPIVIPLSLDPVFSLGVRRPSTRFRILNGARGGFSGGLKGGDRLLGALKLLTEAEKVQIEIYVFGESKPDEIVEGVSVHYVGVLSGNDLAQQYRDADVFAFPSRQETFGQTKIEALACGTPVVAFDETACAEGIEHKVSGWIAPRDDIQAFADGLRYYFDRWKQGEPVRVSGMVDKYQPSAVARGWKDAFESLISGRDP